MKKLLRQMRANMWLGRIAAVSAMWILLCAQAFAQSGTVKSGGQPIPGATVRATQGDRVLTTLTDANGAFTLDKMTPGTWNVTVNMFGFDPVQREVQIGATPTKIDIPLQIGTNLRAFVPQGGEIGRAHV